jgi:outer membrane protein OmpA-like peptidoglycan-associated protein
MRSSVFLFLIPFIFISQNLSGQDAPIVLINPSFEGVPGEGSLNGDLPRGWYDCGFPGETVPDVHPKDGGAFQVTKEPFNGNTYIGMVVRENDTWERISQRLTAPLEGGKCYEFSISLCRSELYVSPSRVDGAMKNYTTPAKLRVWGGSSYCEREELLGESSLVVNTRWLKYDFRFEPAQTHNFIVFEVFYKTPTPFPYNGNILLDDASNIMPVPCKEVPVLVDKKEPKEVKKPEPKPEKKDTPVVASKKKILKELDRSKLRKGQIIKVEQIYFIADSPDIVITSYEVLDELYEFLAENKDVKIEIGGHTNGLPEHEYCDKLSTSRAKAVVDYLNRKGIPQSQLDYKGYGKRRPIAPNNTEKGREKNQRVEVKILSFNG